MGKVPIFPPVMKHLQRLNFRNMQDDRALAKLAAATPSLGELTLRRFRCRSRSSFGDIWRAFAQCKQIIALNVKELYVESEELILS